MSNITCPPPLMSIVSPDTYDQMIRHLPIAILCVSVAGCGNYFAPDRNLKEPLTQKDVIGTWKISTNSLALLVRSGFQAAPTNQYTIAMNPDNTCSFQSVDSFAGKHRYTSVTG